jgi:hypothetical protein
MGRIWPDNSWMIKDEEDIGKIINMIFNWVMMNLIYDILVLFKEYYHSQSTTNQQDHGNSVSLDRGGLLYFFIQKRHYKIIPSEFSCHISINYWKIHFLSRESTGM